MSLPNAAHVACEVGRYYMVPCMLTTKAAGAWWALPGGWVPVVGPKHRDAEHLDVDFEHYHVDWRFIHTKKFQFACDRRGGTPHSTVLSSTHGQYNVIEGSPVLRKLRCLREMPEFPEVRTMPMNVVRRGTNRWAHMERAQAFVCNKLKPGNICPHRGIDLTPFARPDGTAICPGHGLRWNLNTGELMPRQTD